MQNNKLHFDFNFNVNFTSVGLWYYLVRTIWLRQEKNPHQYAGLYYIFGMAAMPSFVMIFCVIKLSPLEYFFLIFVCFHTMVYVTTDTKEQSVRANNNTLST